MKYLPAWGLLLASGLVGCEQRSRPPANAAPPAAVVAPTTAVLPNTALDSYWVRDSLYFGRYLTAHGPEREQTVLYKPHPDSAWTKIATTVNGDAFELDTANVDRAGAPELLLTVPLLRWAGNRGGSAVSILYVLRVGQQIDTLFNVLVNCEDYYDGLTFYSAIDRTQHVTAGYGFVQVGPVHTACEQHHLPQPEPCRCNEDALRGADNPRFARPGRYRWQRGRLRWVAAR